ncbi:hypothetical protein PVAND_001288 [Polypedilum vanderplanki]|uniref:Uncharacterized protein n=1 Tax=Polypedilum vanderplanki TaxID=319348 RepID=A0A9J6BMS4_POLVA|nr:hypothetical protein PVAND_001288 [Polypedilum vanderplanki]
MSCNCDYCNTNQYDSYLNTCPQNQSYLTNCCPPNRTIAQISLEPIFPANEGIFKKSSTKSKKSLANSKKAPKKKSCNNNIAKSKSFESHPQFEDYSTSTRRDKSQEYCEVKQSQQFETQSSASLCSSKMPPLHAEKTLKNFMYDNEDFKETKYKKASCNEIECGPEIETWIFQCPKGFDPKIILDTELGRLSKSHNNVECSANKFKETVSLACLTPEKAIEYESVCDNIKIVKPVGKILITEINPHITSKQSNLRITADESQVIECSDDDDDDDGIIESPSIASKTMKKKINDQKFTIETTIKVENCAASGDRKKNRKGKASDDSFDKCMPICPPEPVPMKKKKRN